MSEAAVRAEADEELPAPPRTRRLTFVTVVFEPELPLLRLQASSFARSLDPECVERFIVLDACARGMGERRWSELADALGPALARRAWRLDAASLGVDGGVEGWRAQQAAKLLVARRIGTTHYVVLDAKNHLIGPVGADDLVRADGLPRGGTHSYLEHPLRPDLERTLRWLGADDAEVDRLVRDFPRTVTPFVVDTARVRRMLDDVEQRTGEPFAVAFEQARALEFFLYSGWSILREHASPVDGRPIPAAMLWPARADERGAVDAISEALTSGASWFAVHRRVLARADRRTLRRIAGFWADRGLMERREAMRFLRRFRMAYAPAVGRARLARRLSWLRRG